MLIEQYPDIITGDYTKGRALESENRMDEAVAAYSLALKSNIQCEYYQAETNEHLALTYYSLGKKDIAANMQINHSIFKDNTGYQTTWMGEFRGLKRSKTKLTNLRIGVGSQTPTFGHGKYFRITS